MFCVSCGKEAKIDSLCEDCFTRQRSLFLVEDSELKICDNCGSYFVGKWLEARPFEELIEDYIKNRVIRLGATRHIIIRTKKVGNVIVATVTLTGSIPPAKKLKEETKTMRIRIRSIKCDNCVKVLGNYYEGVIQLRGPNADKIMKKIRVGMVEKLKNGYDIRFTSKADAARIAKELKKNYSVVTSFKFVTEKKGKKLYRNFYAVR